MANKDTFKCADCGEVYPDSQKSCTRCGSTKKIVYVSCAPVVIVLESEINGMQAKKPHLTGKKKVIWEWTNKKTVRGDNGTPVRRFESIDRENNEYEEIVTDLTTGEITHECKEPLSEHTGHGSAKNNSKNQ